MLMRLLLNCGQIVSKLEDGAIARGYRCPDMTDVLRTVLSPENGAFGQVASLLDVKQR